MKLKIAVMGVAALAAASLSACGGHDTTSAPSMPSGPATQALTTEQVLRLAQKSSEIDTPFAVNDGQLTLTDSSDSAEAISVNGM